ncbi:IclR family transcriptional regulator C-terminal domain-containing protein [Streptomyces sp. NPDC127172]|uniref:IclR family transcriptional regulator domain-containing protein n=1 Tax=Streptomyces sp. NPDC127172 TaxID=3345382 RepID=UPI003642960D
MGSGWPTRRRSVTYGAWGGPGSRLGEDGYDWPGLLRDLDRVRRRGWAAALGDSDRAVSAVGACVHTGTGEPRAAVTLAVPRARMATGREVHALPLALLAVRIGTLAVLGAAAVQLLNQERSRNVIVDRRAQVPRSVSLVTRTSWSEEHSADGSLTSDDRSSQSAVGAPRRIGRPFLPSPRGQRAISHTRPSRTASHS